MEIKEPNKTDILSTGGDYTDLRYFKK